jgi:hypothetical protein
MPTLRCILKYTPAVVIGLLLATWMASCVAFIGVDLSDGWTIDIAEGALACFHYPGHSVPDIHGGMGVDPSIHFGSVRHSSYTNGVFVLKLPIAWAVTTILPLAIGPFISFRFRLWHYLAYTALVALELAYYLRWQE